MILAGLPLLACYEFTARVQYCGRRQTADFLGFGLGLGLGFGFGFGLGLEFRLSLGFWLELG